MDVVDTFNHLIPSDQLDESLIIGQNLESEASNEFGTGLGLEDSLKNMLSDKDPMFGCASSQLDNEDSTFQISGTTGLIDGRTPPGLSAELTPNQTTLVKQPGCRLRRRPQNLGDDRNRATEPANTSTNSMARGRPGRKPVKWLQKSFLIEKGIKGDQLKKELTLGGRINVSHLDAGVWLNPVVVLRRLTVTIGGFKIELLPGPSYEQAVEMAQAAGSDVAAAAAGAPFEESAGLAELPNAAVGVENPVPEAATEMDVTEQSSADDAALAPGPYVNPNDVQASNGTVAAGACAKDAELDNQNVPEKQEEVSEGKDDIQEPPSDENNRSPAAGKTDGKAQRTQTPAKALPKSKQGPTANRSKDLDTANPNNAVKGQKPAQNMPSTVIQREDLHKTKPPKEKKDAAPLKRPAESSQTEHVAKIQKTQGSGDGRAKPKVASPTSPVAKKPPAAHGTRPDQPGPARHAQPPGGSRAEAAQQPPPARPGASARPPDADAAQEKPKPRKPEKIAQRQKSKSAKSVSVDEPQLFVPDNAPAVKRESADEAPANSDSVWDGNNCCGLCKKHHNNMFMVGCGRCEDWFHGDCVGLDLTKVREMEEEDQMYVCLKCCEEESTRAEPEPEPEPAPSAAKPEALVKAAPPPKPRAGPSQALSPGGTRPDKKESERKQSSDARDAAPSRAGAHLKQEARSKAASSASRKPVSSEAIRRSVRDSLKEILIQRLKESELSVSAERACEIAKKTERELFHSYKDTDNKYKNKYRSLMFNLKDTKNNVLFKKVLKGEISPGNLIRMSPEELASKELAAWRKRENRHTIEMIEKEQREAERRPITKITHKGEIEIESQEPPKAPELVEVESPPKAAEVSAEAPRTPEKKEDAAKTEKDTTGQHKSHLFDLHCKICTGRMAPPVEEAPTKVVKVATTVLRRQSTKAEDSKSASTAAVATPSTEDDLHLTVLEESFRNAQPGSHTVSRDEETVFLAGLASLWRGIINMHAVAKFVTKAFPVSGAVDHLTEDLPDSVQVGGRISPQIVWDYLEKIRATGTKEVCLIRFSPETEEDEISYTLLYAYFSSRKRFGVVSNNLKQVKDMYLIPLGATEKVPHQLVPFDGPGLENNRANLLLGLIIRQRPKRDFLPVDLNETARIIPEVKPVPVSTKDPRTTEEDEKLFLSTLTAVHNKEKDKPAAAAKVADEPVTEPLEKPSASEEAGGQDSQKPLRFLPGVLVGWGGELPPLPDFGVKPARAANDAQKPQPAAKAEATTVNTKSPTAAVPRERFVIKKKEAKPGNAQPEASGSTHASAANSSAGRGAAGLTPGGPVSLKDKPPDVSTEAFLASLSTAPGGTESSSSASANKGDAGPLSETEKGASDGNPLSQSKSQAAAAHTNGSKAPLSGILKKSSAYASVTADTNPVLQKEKVSCPAPPSPAPAPPSSATRNESVTPFHQGYLQLFQAKSRPEQKKPAAQPCPGDKEEPGRAGAAAAPAAAPSEEQAAPPAACNAGASEHDSGAAPAPSQQPQGPGSYQNPIQNHSTAWGLDGAVHAIPGLDLDSDESQNLPQGPAPALDPALAPALALDPAVDPALAPALALDPALAPALALDPALAPALDPALAPAVDPALAPALAPAPGPALDPAPAPSPALSRDSKRVEEQYNDPWERPRSSEDRDHHGRYRDHRDSHHGKKSRYYERDRDRDRDRERDRKYERSHDDKYRERSRHHGYSDDRHGERRKERDDYSSRHKDRYRHRRDSENGRRSSNDRYT